MRKNNINIRILFIMLLSIVMINSQAQTGLNFQGVARTTNNVILASQAITIKLSILQGSATGTTDYTETRKVMTNAQGLFTAVIGDTGAISTLGNFTTINWKLSPKFLKIEMDAAAGTNFITMGTTQFQYVAYAQFAKSVDAENIVGIVPVTLGGTGVNSLTGLKTALTLNNVNNTTDLTKPISTLTQTALDLKLNAADTSKYTKKVWVDSALVAKQFLIGLKLNADDTIKYTKKVWIDSALMTKLSTTVNAVFLPTIVIGTQQWMRENLDVVTYQNGDIIPQVSDQSAWEGLTTGAWCYFNNDPAYGAIYGKLYNWYAVNDSRGLAPKGWHIPSDAEWTILGTKLGGYNSAGGKMKSTGTTLWTTPNAKATNESGFVGLPGGFRDPSNLDFMYAGKKDNIFASGGYWWTATEFDPNSAYFRSVWYAHGDLYRVEMNKRNGYSVRCIRD